MKKLNKNWILPAAFCLYLGLFLLGFLLLPGKGYSEKEKRALAAFPALSAESLLSGRFESELESWAAEQLPGRDFFVSLNARFERAAGLQVTKEIYLGEDGRLFERPSVLDPQSLTRNRRALETFAEQLGQEVYVMLVPSAGYLMPEKIEGLADPYRDGEITAAFFDGAGERLIPVPLTERFEAEADRGALFYRTDHHWTSRGAYEAFRLFAEQVGKSVPAAEDYTVERVGGFWGSCWSRAGFWSIPPEELELWSSGGEMRVTFSEREGSHDGLFFRERLEAADKYPVWLDGNHPLVTVENLDPAAQGRLLVIRDSFANCLGCFLADAWKEVTLVDLRYYREPVSALCEGEGYDQILFVYSIRNLTTDSNIVWLR